MLDFGAARVENGDDYGTIDYSGVWLSNSDILAALERASDGVHKCYTTGTLAIAYGTSNYGLTASGMTDSQAVGFGQWQAQRADDLYSYERNNGRVEQDSAIGVDMEPAWDERPISNDLVNGANDIGDELDYDYGSADGCPTDTDNGSCANGWGQNDVAYASFHGMDLPMPEIYYSVNALQWGEIQRNWDANQSNNYYFAGLTIESGGLSAGGAWDDLVDAAKSGTVNTSPGIICFC